MNSIQFIKNVQFLMHDDITFNDCMKYELFQDIRQILYDYYGNDEPIYNLSNESLFDKFINTKNKLQLIYKSNFPFLSMLYFQDTPKAFTSIESVSVSIVNIIDYNIPTIHVIFKNKQNKYELNITYYKHLESITINSKYNQSLNRYSEHELVRTLYVEIMKEYTILLQLANTDIKNEMIEKYGKNVEILTINQLYNLYLKSLEYDKINEELKNVKDKMHDITNSIKTILENE